MMTTPPASRKYLDLDSNDFKTAILFFIFAMVCLVAMPLSFWFGVADIWGVMFGVFILMFGITAGSFLHRARVDLTVGDGGEVDILPDDESDTFEDEGDELVDIQSVNSEASGATAAADGGSRLTPDEVKARFDLYEFVAAICDGTTVGEGAWAVRGMPQGDYRYLINYLAELGIVMKRDGAKPSVLVPFPTALKAIATERGDPEFYWYEVKEILPNMWEKGRLTSQHPYEDDMIDPSPLPNDEPLN